MPPAKRPEGHFGWVVRRAWCPCSLRSFASGTVATRRWRSPCVNPRAADELHGFVDSDEVDLALMPAPVPGRFTITTVAEEEIVLTAPTGHPLAEQPTVRLEDLEGVRVRSLRGGERPQRLARSLVRSRRGPPGARDEDSGDDRGTAARCRRPGNRRMPRKRAQRWFSWRSAIVLATMGQTAGGGDVRRTGSARRPIHRATCAITAYMCLTAYEPNSQRTTRRPRRRDRSWGRGRRRHEARPRRQAGPKRI